MLAVQTRLHLGLLISLCVLLAVQWWVVTSTINDLVETSFIGQMRDDTDALLSNLTFTPEGSPVLNAPSINAAYHQPFSGRYYIVRADDRWLYSRSLWDTSLPVDTLAPGGEVIARADGPQKSHLLLLRSGFHKQNHDLTMLVAYDLSPLETERQQFAMLYGTVTFAALLLLVIVQSLTVRSALKPIERIRADVQRLHSGHAEVLTENAPREIAPLVREINTLIATVERRLQRSRHAVGDLAHALKTPLAVLTQLAGSDTVRNDAALHKQLREQVDAIRVRMEKELARARLAGAGHTGSHFRVAEELPALCKLLERSYGEKNVTIDYDIPPDAVVPQDQEDMLELLGNLLDNACKWARQRVRVRVQTSGPVIYSVEDDGPGCPPELRDVLTERGRRLDESVAGHGLGLSIVKHIVDDYDGALKFDTSPDLGGLRVEVTIRVPPVVS